MPIRKYLKRRTFVCVTFYIVELKYEKSFEKDYDKRSKDEIRGKLMKLVLSARPNTEVSVNLQSSQLKML